MKLIVENATNLVKYAFADDTVIVVEDVRIVTPEFIIGDLHAGNTTLLENAPECNDVFCGDWFRFQNNAWEISENHPSWSMNG